jgi:hypothetical protein
LTFHPPQLSLQATLENIAASFNRMRGPAAVTHSFCSIMELFRVSPRQNGLLGITPCVRAGGKPAEGVSMKVILFGALASAVVVAPAVAQTASTAPVAPTATLAPPPPTPPLVVTPAKPAPAGPIVPTATLASPPATAPLVVAAAPAPDPNVLRIGTPVMFKMSETLTTRGKKLQSGYLAHLEVLDPVLVNGVVVIPVGSPAVAEITDVRNKGMWGKSGRINARMLYVMVGDRRIRLRGVFDDKGVTGTAGVVAAIATVPVVGFFTTGTSATLDIGAGVKGFVDEDVPLSLGAGTPRPPVVAAASPATPSSSATVGAAVAGTVASQLPSAMPAVAAAQPTDASPTSEALTITQAKRATHLYTASGQNGSIYQVNEGPGGSVTSVEFIYDGRIVTVPGSTLSAGRKQSQLKPSLTSKEIGKL